MQKLFFSFLAVRKQLTDLHIVRKTHLANRDVYVWLSIDESVLNLTKNLFGYEIPEMTSVNGALLWSHVMVK